MGSTAGRPWPPESGPRNWSWDSDTHTVRRDAQNTPNTRRSQSQHTNIQRAGWAAVVMSGIQAACGTRGLLPGRALGIESGGGHGGIKQEWSDVPNP